MTQGTYLHTYCPTPYFYHVYLCVLDIFSYSLISLKKNFRQFEDALLLNSNRFNGWMIVNYFNMYDPGLSVLKAMFLVYCALEKEPVPMSLPPALVPPSKRKTVSISGSVRLIPTSAAAKESYHSLPPVVILPTKAPLRQV